MSAPLSNELFFEAHRGIIHDSPLEKNVGVHFSSSPEVARAFATRSFWKPGLIYHAQIPVSSVETNTKQLVRRGYASFPGKNNLGEKEVMVKEGAPIKVTGVTKLSSRRAATEEDTRRVRKRTYNPPREMRA